MIKTCEFVSRMHPDKLCDQIADSILDAHLLQDPMSRVAIEVMGGHGAVTICGEVTSKAEVDIPSIVATVVGKELKVDSRVVKQSPFIAQGVDTGGAGDQGIMVGYATAETESLMPREYELARNLCQEVFKVYPYDGKTQVTIDGDRVTTVVVSFQNSKNDDLLKLVRSLIPAAEYIVNFAGEWSMGGFDADTGATGRKIVVDAYGPQITVGGGAYSGKDATKVDRSAAYLCRKIAVDMVKKGAAEVLVKLAYAIGKSEPVMATAIVDGKPYAIKNYDFSPQSIIERFELRKPQFRATAEWGHYGRGFAWDK